MSRPHTTPARRARVGAVRVVVLSADSTLARRTEAALAGAGTELVDSVASVEALLALRADCDVAVIAEDVSASDAVAAIRALREGAGVARVVVVHGCADGHAARRGLEAGADGMVAADDIERALPAAVEAVAAGLVAVPQAVRRTLAPVALSHRERQVIALVVDGCTNAEIAQRLFLSESTIKSHLASAFARLGVRSRRDAAAFVLAGERGLSG